MKDELSHHSPFQKWTPIVQIHRLKEKQKRKKKQRCTLTYTETNQTYFLCLFCFSLFSNKSSNSIMHLYFWNAPIFSISIKMSLVFLFLYFFRWLSYNHLNGSHYTNQSVQIQCINIIQEEEEEAFFLSFFWNKLSILPCIWYLECTK